MQIKHQYYYPVFLVLIIILGLGLAFVQTSVNQPQGYAAESKAGEQKLKPELTRYYVARTGDGSDGSSWEKAFPHVQAALVVAAATGGGEIWVAKGIYYPDESWYDDNSRVATFYLQNNIKLYGGFDTKDTKFTDRDWKKNVTVLSGDIDKNDFKNSDGVVVDTDDINGNNAYHVISAIDINISAVLDGFTITAGSANVQSGKQQKGGGFFCNGSGAGKECSPSLKNLVFSGNFARYGGGLYIEWNNGGTSFPNLEKITFSNNTAILRGGAIYNSGSPGGASRPNLKDVIFNGNHAGDFGGGIYISSYSGIHNLNMTRVTFSRNTSEYGGAISHHCSYGSCNPTWKDVIFSGNWAGDGGGAVSNTCEVGTCSPTLINVIFSGNSAGGNGGAMKNDSEQEGESKPNLINVTFSGNFADKNGGAMYNYSREGFEGSDTNPELRNCILWGNYDNTGSILRINSSDRELADVYDNIYNQSDAKVTLKNSLLEGSGGSKNWISLANYLDGGGNIDKDPMFVKPVDPKKAPTTSGDLHLSDGSPAIDTGNNIFVTDVPKDLDGNQRKVDGDGNGTKIVDMGAYEALLNCYLPMILKR
jgi:predicted outer membrane repeat protein